jgi:hypothetical protein
LPATSLSLRTAFCMAAEISLWMGGERARRLRK